MSSYNTYENVTRPWHTWEQCTCSMHVCMHNAHFWHHVRWLGGYGGVRVSLCQWTPYMFFTCEISSASSLKIKRCKTMAYMRAMHMQHACMHNAHFWHNVWVYSVVVQRIGKLVLAHMTVHAQCTVSARTVHSTVHVQCTIRFSLIFPHRVK